MINDRAPSIRGAQFCLQADLFRILNVGKMSLAVTKYCVPLHQLDESNVGTRLDGDRLSIHMFFL